MSFFASAGEMMPMSARAKFATTAREATAMMNVICFMMRVLEWKM